MIQQIVLITLYLLIISPILFYTIKIKSRDTFNILIIFILFVYIHHILLTSYTIETFRVFKQYWNWSGKLFAIIGSILFLIIYKKYPISEYGITFRQKSNSIRFSLIILSIFVFASILIGFFASEKSNFNLDTLMFQLTMPGFDEELAYRGIMIGLLGQVLVSNLRIKKINFGNPSVLITSIIFGLLHALNLDNNYNLSFNFIFFLQTFAMGFIFGLVFVKSKSILFPIIIHNITNTLMVLIPMLL